MNAAEMDALTNVKALVKIGKPARRDGPERNASHPRVACGLHGIDARHGTVEGIFQRDKVVIPLGLGIFFVC